LDGPKPHYCIIQVSDEENENENGEKSGTVAPEE
jgi:hypothetical protein